jgi:hypothetical protein
MMRAPRLLLGAIDRLRYRWTFDQATVKDELHKTDPDFRRVSEVQHDAINILAARKGANGLSIRREREFWERSHK